MHGLLVLDKPLGLTSRDAVNRVQRQLPRGTKLGHTGTLDPLATGVLVLTVGHATRLAEYVQAMGKTYVADVALGATSATDDAQGLVTPTVDAQPPTRAAIDAALPMFVGTIEQTPPAFSAVKLAGRRAYDLARRGDAVEIAPRPVRIDRIDVLEYAYPLLRLEIACGKGTYIRSLARDLGALLGVGGYLTALRRTRVGPFTVDVAGTPEALPPLRPLAEAVAGLPRIDVSAADAGRLRNGQFPQSSVAPADDIAVFDPAEALVAIVAATGQSLRPLKVFPTTNDLDRRAADELDPPSRSRAVLHHLFWPIIFAVSLLAYELTHEAGLGAAIACTKFGWDDILTAFWLRRADPDRPRGRAAFWLFLAAGLWKVALTGVAVMFAVPFVLIALKQPQRGMGSVMASAAIAALLGFSFSALATFRAILGARVNRVRLWLDSRVHFDREKRRWPPRVGPPGRRNCAGAVMLTAFGVVGVVLVVVLLTVAGSAARGWANAAGVQPNAVRGFFTFAILALLVFLGVGVLVIRDALLHAVIARTPDECWGPPR